VHRGRRRIYQRMRHCCPSKIIHVGDQEVVRVFETTVTYSLCPSLVIVP
jgi:hypothetical protein